MGVTTTVKDLGEKELMRKLADADRSFVTVGVHKDKRYPDGTSVALVAFFNEFGTQTIPERSFIRSAVNEKLKRIERLRNGFLRELTECQISVVKALEKLGFVIQTQIQNKIKSNVPPPNKISTLDQKLGRRTLIDSGRLLNSIAFEVKQ